MILFSVKHPITILPTIVQGLHENQVHGFRQAEKLN